MNSIVLIALEYKGGVAIEKPEKRIVDAKNSKPRSPMVRSPPFSRRGEFFYA